MNQYNRKADYIYVLADYIFWKKCKAERVEPFCKFMGIVATIDWIDHDNKLQMCVCPTTFSGYRVFFVLQ